MLRSISKVWRIHVVSPEEEEEGYRLTQPGDDTQ